MTLSHQADVYETPKAQSIRNRSEYSFVLGLIVWRWRWWWPV